MNFVRQWFVVIVSALLWACSTDDNSKLNTIDIYLMNNNIDSAQLTESGIYFVINSVIESSVHPTDSHTIELAYTLRLTNGEVIEHRNSSDPLFRNIRLLIPALREGLPLFGTGESGILIVPSNLVTLTDSSGSIPPNADLVFNIQLLDVYPFAKEYIELESNSIFDTIIRDTSATDTIPPDTIINRKTAFSSSDNGIFYSIDSDTIERSHPNLTNSVSIRYQGFYTNGDRFASSDSLTIDLMDANIIEGWKTAIPILEVGEKGTFVVPYQLAYGLNGNRALGVPGYTDVVFDIELLTIQ